MKRIIIGIFIGIWLLTFGCAKDQASGVFYVDAQILNMGITTLSVKYYIGDTVMFDDIQMDSNIGIFQMIKDSGETTVPLKIVINFQDNEDDSYDESSLQYYYGANFLSESKSHTLESLVLLAKENEYIFDWDYKDGAVIKKDKKKAELTEPSTSSDSKTIKEEKSEKL